MFDAILDGEGLLPLASPTITLSAALEGLVIRVRAVFKDGHDVIEAVTSAATAPIAAGAPPAPPTPLPDMTATDGDDAGVHYIRSDLQFILDQIKIAEAHAAGADLSIAYSEHARAGGLAHGGWLVQPPAAGRHRVRRGRQSLPAHARSAMARRRIRQRNYNSGTGVVDSTPRTISNLIVDQTPNNPAAVEANGGNPSVMSPGLDGIFGTLDDREVFFIRQ